MLYVTTRTDRDAFTASKVLNNLTAPDGALFVPFRLAPMDPAKIDSFMELGFARCTAEVLNHFFSTKLSGWDVDFCVGKNLCKTKVMNHRIAVAELWHNQGRGFDWMVGRLSARLKDVSADSDTPGEWTWLAVRIAALFGAFSELHRGGILERGQKLDIAVAADDFSQAVAAWYARFLGLGVGNILCACSEFSGSWDLMNYGQMRTDAVPSGLERLIFLTLGQEEAARFASVCETSRPYILSAVQTELLRSGLFSAVVGTRRINNIIPNVYSSSEYLLDPNSALAYGGIQDFRAKTGEVRPTLILSEQSPFRCADAVSRAMGMTARQLMDQFHQS